MATTIPIGRAAGTHFMTRGPVDVKDDGAGSFVPLEPAEYGLLKRRSTS